MFSTAETSVHVRDENREVMSAVIEVRKLTLNHCRQLFSIHINDVDVKRGNDA